MVDAPPQQADVAPHNSGADLQLWQKSRAPCGDAWFEPTVTHIVGSLTPDPCLKLVSLPGWLHSSATAAPSIRSIMLPRPNGSTLPQLPLEAAFADAVVLVQPIPAECDAHASRLCPADGHDLADSGHCAPPEAGSAPPREQELQQAAVLPGMPTEDTMLSGRVGDCCAEDAGHEAAGPAHSQHSHAHGAAQVPHPAQCDGSTAYYGLVVQCRATSRLTGCYLLKTVRATHGSAGEGCHCTHFALTKVCQGQPLAQQLMQSWLA